MFVRRAAAAAVALAMLLVLLPGSAGAKTARAATAVTSLNRIALAGTTSTHQDVTGHFTVQRFMNAGGREYAVGLLTGKIGNHTFTRKDVAIPVSVEKGTPGMARGAALSCPILHLVLGPLNLNLLGLHVHLNKVVLDITAVPGAGNLLGNLLCSVSNLLNGPGLSLQQLNGLLNILQQLVDTPALLGL